VGKGWQVRGITQRKERFATKTFTGMRQGPQGWAEEGEDLAKVFKGVFKTSEEAGCWWLTAVILATQKVEVGRRRILVQSQSGQIVCENLSQKHPTQKRAGAVVHRIELLPSKREALSSNPSNTKKKKKKERKERKGQ
jgi:hypothetical protein